MREPLLDETGPVERSGRRGNGASGAVWLALAVLAVAVAHAPSLRNGFAYDDAFTVTQNALVQEENFARLFGTDYWAGAGVKTGYYRPVLMATYAANHAISGLAPWPYHLTNLAVHLAAAALVFACLRAVHVSAGSAALATLLFGIHPVQVESVGGISNRGDPLAAMFALSTVYAFFRARVARGTLGRTVWLVLSGVAYFGSCFSKESGILAAPLVVAFDLFILQGGRLRRQWVGESFRLVAWGLYAAVLATYLVARARVAGPVLRQSVAFITNPLAFQPFLEQKALAVVGVGRYLRLLAYPRELSADYSYAALPLEALLTPGLLLLGSAALVAWGVGMAWAWRRDGLLAFGLAWAGATFLLTSNLIFPVDVMFAERFLYLSLIGMAFVAAALLKRFDSVPPRLRRIIKVASAIFLLGWGARSAARQLDWRDAATLYAAAARVVPDSAKVWFGLGQVRSDVGDLRGAAVAYERAVRILPGYADALSDGAVAFSGLGEHERAITFARRAVEEAPGDALAWNNLGFVLYQAGNLEGALPAFERAGFLGAPNGWGNAAEVRATLTGKRRE